MAFTANAQTPIFHEGFDAEQTKAETALGWYEYINSQAGDSRVIVADEPFAGAGCLQIINDPSTTCEGQGWQRAIKFRNLPLESGKIYQIDFAFKGSNRYNKEGGEVDPVNDPRCEMRVGLMQGYENTDISILDAKGGDQTKTQSYFNPTEYEKYSYKFYFASKENQDAQYQAQGKDIQYINSYFATLNIINPGTFYLDEFTLTEINSAVDVISYGGDGTIRVKYMFDTTIPALAKAETIGRVILDPSCATVTIDGEKQDLEAVELHKDGYLYVFLTDASWQEATESEIVVSFTNPDEIVNFAGDNKDAKMFAFEAVKAATYDPELASISSFIWEQPVLVSSNPAINSFCLEETISEFTLTFDHMIYTCDNDYADPPTAVLSTGEQLAIKPGQDELSKSITFVRTGDAPLTKGMYSITVSNITSEVGITMGDDVVVPFETGKIKMAQIVYTDLFTNLLVGPNGGQPEGWTILIGGEDWNGGEPKEDNGSACRNINMTKDGEEYTAFYLCDRDGYTYMQYGDKEGYALTLPAGDLAFSVLAVGHESASRRVEYRIEDMAGNVLATASEMTDALAENNFAKMSALTVKFNNPTEQNVILKIREPEGGYTACRIMGVKCQSYVETPGDKFEPEVVFEGKFTGANMPAADSGWLFYENNNQLEPGSGRNGTSGMLERNFHAKMPTAAFFRECGTNSEAAMRIEYGNGNGVEGLEIPEGGYELTYYAGTWNDQGGNDNGTSKVFMQIINYETGEIAFTSEHVNIANFKNGGDCSGQADKVTETFNCKGGKFYIKAWGTTNTVWGALSIVKPGSQAAKWYAAMAEAVEEAEGEAEISAAEKYDGATKTALLAAIEKGKDPSAMHTVEEFEAAIAALNALKDNMAARRKNVDAFDGNRTTLAGAIESATGTKFEGLEVYPKAVACYDTYKEVNSLDLDDETLASAVADMGSMGQLINNMMGTCVNLLTAQEVELANMIVALDETAADNELVVAARESIKDDQVLVNALKKVYTLKLYQKIAAGENVFQEYDPDLEISTPKEIAAGAMIQNRNFYCTAIVPDKDQTAIAKVTDYPGWTIEVFAGDIRPVFNTGWGEDGNAPRANKPIADAAVRANWGTNNYDVHQLVENMPVALYNVSLVVGKDGDQETESYAYLGEGENQLKSVYLGTDRATGEAQVFNNYVPEIDGALGKMLIGGYINITGSFGSIDKADLTMIAPAEGFNYAAAAAALEKEIADGIQSVVVPQGEPVRVEYYTIGGAKVATPAVGTVVIKAAVYANGVKTVSKHIVK